MKNLSDFVLPVIGAAARQQGLRPIHLVAPVRAAVSAAYAAGLTDGVSSMNHMNLCERATRAYFRRFGSDAIQPVSGHVTQTTHGRYVTLSNARGSLAIYRLQAGRLAFFMTGKAFTE